MTEVQRKQFQNPKVDKLASELMAKIQDLINKAPSLHIHLQSEHGSLKLVKDMGISFKFEKP